MKGKVSMVKRMVAVGAAMVLGLFGLASLASPAQAHHKTDYEAGQFCPDSHLGNVELMGNGAWLFCSIDPEVKPGRWVDVTELGEPVAGYPCPFEGAISDSLTCAEDFDSHTEQRELVWKLQPVTPTPTPEEKAGDLPATGNSYLTGLISVGLGLLATGAAAVGFSRFRGVRS